MAAVAVDQQAIDDPWRNAAAKRTAAMPKHSLFGTALEVYDQEDIESIKRIDPKEHQKLLLERRKKDKLKLPDSLRSQLLSGSDEYVAKNRAEYEKLKALFNKTDNSIREAERDALSFRGNQTYTNKSSRLSEEAAQLARRMNRVGLNERSSYNYDKYGKERKLPAHQYSLIGDILRPGNDFAARREKTDIPIRSQNTNNNMLQTCIGRQPSARGENSPRAAIDIPPNIKHQYGTRVCDNLLSDEKVVKQTLEEQAKSRASGKKKDRVSITALEKQLKPEYEQLGNFMRQNVFPGYTIDHHTSTTKSVYTDDVHLNRNPDPDKWRYQRDELSSWSEHNILRDRMKKSWEQYLGSQPKAQVNWDRNAKAPPKPILKDPEKPKKPPQKPKNTKPKENKPKDSEFADIKFVTPPVTPPPEKVKLAPKTGKDSEFWDYYEKGGKQ
ncbi:uncharacterized protein LOC127736252 isoform X1 [Mytilus californianus]|uniref:uncharacterized protein LOC127700002 isoform X1 n=1 Tax=Mytilus californianus TaxID=6549 RepID=UPI0022465142|nr:uncharacterized protein LOC127700002 isoform X1 [Mytilus californianus]XP_052102806.1 uncharacterized protein LOC127736252 isoform X1 [Mytilus californianus]